MNKFWNNRKVMITGHTGFKGSWLSMWLNKLGANISGISLRDSVSNPNLFTILNLKELSNDHRGDIVSIDNCFNAIKEENPEIIFHMAAQPLVRKSYEDPLETFNTNVIGTLNILQCALKSKSIKSIVVITTDKCYENNESDYAFVETDTLGGFDPYSSSKVCAEHVVSSYYKSFFKEKGIGLATARAGNVIGGGDWSVYRIIPDAMISWSQNKRLLMRSPSSIRPWQHVLEPLSGYLMLAEYLFDNPDEISGPWNFGPDENSIKTVEEIIELASKYWSNYVLWDIEIDNSLYETQLLKLNSQKARSILGWKPRWDIDKAIFKTTHWYNNYYSGSKDMINLTLKQISEYENQSF